MISPKINVNLAVIKYKTALLVQNLQELTLSVPNVKANFIYKIILALHVLNHAQLAQARFLVYLA